MIETKIIEDELKEMRLPKMLEEYKNQRNNIDYQNKTFDERFGELVNREYDSRFNNTVSKYIKKADFYFSCANLNDINYNPNRKLDQKLIETLRTNDYIKAGLNIIFIGASGCGKTWLGCAFGINACQSRFRTKYIRLPEFFSELEVLITTVFDHCVQ